MDKCKYCDSHNLEQRVKTPHLGLYCGDCGKFQQWVKQVDDDGTIASDKQARYALALFEKWKRSGKSMTAAQAGGIIKLFKE